MSAVGWLPQRARVPLAAALGVVMLLVSIGVGLRGDPFAFLFPFGRGPGLDYSAGPNGFVPLDPGYVADVLGEDLVEPVDGDKPGLAAGADPRSSSFEPPRRLTDVHELTNDDREDARAVPGVPFTARTNTAEASREPGEPNDCGRIGDWTVWYRYAPPRDVGLIANTFGSSYGTALGVYEQADDGALSNVGCDSDLDGNTIYQFSAVRGVTYLFQIAGTTGGGELIFNLEPQGTTTLASANPRGEPADNMSDAASMSADGRYVAFRSAASDLAPEGDSLPCSTRERGDGVGRTYTSATHPSQPCWQVIVHDRAIDTFTYASVNDANELSNGDTYALTISGNGRYVAFASSASNLVDEDRDGLFDDDTNGVGDLFVHDLVTRRTERINRTYDGKQVEFEPDLYGGNDFVIYGASAFDPSLSFDGRSVAWASTSSRIVEGDTNAAFDVFVTDRLTRLTQRVSVSSEGRQGWGDSRRPSISADGRFVAFDSLTSTLDWDDTNWQNRARDVYVHDRRTGETSVESLSSTAEIGNGESRNPRLSADGRYLAFTSSATNLVDGDTNGIPDVFVRDLIGGTTTRVSVSSAGEEARSEVSEGSETRKAYGGVYTLARYGPLLVNLGELTMPVGISADGRYVAFQTLANNLAPEDENESLDVFVHDRATATTIRVSVNARGDAFQGDSYGGGISADGRIVVFDSAPQLHDPSEDITIHDIQVYVHERAGAVP